MPSWILKSAIQRAISYLPRSHRWNALLQKKISRGYFSSQATFEGKLALCRRHLTNYRKFSTNPVEGFSAVELGSGSWPVVPIGLYLCGAKEIWTYDILPLLERETIRHTLIQFAEAIREGSLARFLPDAREHRMEKLLTLLNRPINESPSSVLETLQIHLRIGDASKTGLPSRSVHFVFSTVVLEHIPGPVLINLFAEFRRVLIPSGVMSHYIGLADQYASVDQSITPFNFLRYTRRQWRWLNNPIISQTRLRIQDHRDLLRQGGFTLADEDNVLGKEEDLRSVPLALEFSHHPFEDLRVLFSWMVSIPAAEQD